MPCTTCTNEARCDELGLCQDFAREQLQQHNQAAARDCIGSNSCWWPQCTCEVIRLETRPAVDHDRSKA